MKCCNQSSPKASTTQKSSIPLTRKNSLTTSIDQINCGFQFDSGFCQYCGVDVSLFAHEFWCKLANL